jgi:uracil phosphoribosyltransferase
MIRELGKENSILGHFIGEVRDALIQRDPLRFRFNLERIGEIFAYEISKELVYADQEVQTSLGMANARMLKEKPVLATILRAGLAMHNGLLRFFDHSQNAFVSAFRKHHKNGRFDVQVEYISCPDLENRILILSDPMVATGTSMLLAYKALLEKGKPAHTHIVAIIASVEGISYLRRHINEDDYTLWVGAVDDELTAQAYIVPGLGDAGDLAFGSKI